MDDSDSDDFECSPVHVKRRTSETSVQVSRSVPNF